MPDLFAEGEQYLTRSDKPHLRVRFVPGWTAIHDDGNLVPMQGVVQLQIKRSFLTDKQVEVYDAAQHATETMLFIGAQFDADWIDVMLARHEVSDAFDALAKSALLLDNEGYTSFRKEP